MVMRRVSRLALSAVVLGWGSAAVACPTFQVVGNEAYDVPGNLDRTGFSVVAGGNNDAQFCGGIFPVNAPSIYGYFISPPDFSFFLQGAPQAQVRVFTNSPDPSCDTVLLTNTPTADWYFNDDANQLQSEIVMTNVPEGRLDVWVGTYDGSFCQTDLVLEVISAAAAPATDDGPKPSGTGAAEAVPEAATDAAPAAEAVAPAASAPAEAAPATVDAPLPPGVEPAETEGAAEGNAEGDTTGDDAGGDQSLSK